VSGKLEQRLEALGAALDVPPVPDVVPAVLAGLTARRGRPRRPASRVLAVAVAATVLLVGAAMAVPPSRDAILRAIGLRGVSIERVRHLPPIPAGAKTGARLELGQPISLARVRHAAGFIPLLPPHASGAYIGHDVPGGRISIVLGRVLITEFRGVSRPVVFKTIDPGTEMEVTGVDGTQGVYLSGAPHQVLYATTNGQIRTDRVRLAGNVLIWQQERVIVRIEGTHTLAEALAIARSLRR